MSNYFAYGHKTVVGASSLALGRGVGSTWPLKKMNLRDVLAHLEARPNDKYLLRHLPEVIKKFSDEEIRWAISEYTRQPSLSLFSILLYVDAKKFPELKSVLSGADANNLRQMARAHPLVDVRRAGSEASASLLYLWNRWVVLNRHRHLLPGEIDSAVCFPQGFLPSNSDIGIPLSAVFSSTSLPLSHRTGTSLRMMPVEETVRRILSLATAIVKDLPMVVCRYGPFYISQFHWEQTSAVDIGRHCHSVTRDCGSSGKGLNAAAVFLSGAMEMLERYSALEGSTEHWPAGYQADLSLRYAAFSALQAEETKALNPNAFNLTIPYANQSLYWVKGEEVTSEGVRSVWIPAQIAFLHSNLDEPEVFYTSSNGLAAGNTMAEAKLHALLEVVERDGDFSMFYLPERCFVLKGANPDVDPILDFYRSKGLAVQLLDLTTEFAVPTYRAFIRLGNQLLSGSGAHLDGRIAAMRALCELATKCYGFEQEGNRLDSTASAEAVRPEIDFDALPNFSSGNVEEDLRILQTLLIANGLRVAYVDLTRADLGISVVRALVPSLDIPEEISRRQVRHFCQLFGASLQAYSLETAGR